MNVLLTSAGRRSYLVRYFREALNGRGRVLVANSHRDAAAVQAADEAYVVPPASDPRYGETVLDLCRSAGVRLLCSCHDLDTLALSGLRHAFHAAGITAILPDPDWARIALDKLECAARLRAGGFAVPWTAATPEEALAALDRGAIRFPLVIKARSGFGSLGLEEVHDRAALEFAFVDGGHGMATVGPRIVQEHLGRIERTLIVVGDLEGRYAGHLITDIHSMRAGESDWATTLASDALGDLPQRLAALTRHAGPWGFDLMMRNGTACIIDVNPRFTGDYPFHHLAGADLPAALLAWAAGQTPDPAWLRSTPGVTGFKDLVPTVAQRIG